MNSWLSSARWPKQSELLAGNLPDWSKRTRAAFIFCAGCMAMPAAADAEFAAYIRQLPAVSQLADYPQPGDIAGWRRKQQQLEQLARPAAAALVRQSGCRLTTLQAGGLQILKVSPPQARPDAYAIYLHGGAFTLLSARSTAGTAALFARATGLDVYIPDYPLAPQHDWQQIQQQLQRSVGALRTTLGARQTVLFADSAGASLATVLALQQPDIGAVVLWSPWLDLTTRRPRTAAEPYFDDQRHLLRAAAAYARPADWRLPAVSPLLGDFSRGFPPVLVQSGSRDLLFSDSERLVTRLREAGVVVQPAFYQGLVHVAPLALPQAAASQRWLADSAVFIRQRLDTAVQATASDATVPTSAKPVAPAQRGNKADSG